MVGKLSLRDKKKKNGGSNSDHMEVYELSVPFLLTSITITLTPKL
jgi:hypothetical protein